MLKAEIKFRLVTTFFCMYVLGLFTFFAQIYIIYVSFFFLFIITQMDLRVIFQVKIRREFLERGTTGSVDEDSV